MEILCRIREILKNKKVRTVSIIIICVALEFLALESNSLHEFSQHPIVKISKVINGLIGGNAQK